MSFNFSHLIGGNAKKASKKAETDDENKNGHNANDPNQNDDNNDKSNGKSGKKANNSNTDDDDDDEKKAQGKKSERQRCAAIFSSSHAAGKADMAAHLAFNTNLTAKEAIGILATMPSSLSSSSFDQRMAEVGNFNVGDGNSSNNGENNLEATKNLYLKVMGKK